MDHDLDTQGVGEATASTGATRAAKIETAKLNDVNPYAYLKATLKATAAGHAASDSDHLLPRAIHQPQADFQVT